MALLKDFVDDNSGDRDDESINRASSDGMGWLAQLVKDHIVG